MIRRLATLAAAALVVAAPAAAAPAAVAAPAAATVATATTAKPPKGASSVRVLKVTDGDTIRISYKGKSTPVRLIGLNAPEMSPASATRPRPRPG